jgi:hypothetical protein
MSQIYEKTRKLDNDVRMKRLAYLDSSIQSSAREPATRADTMSPGRLSVPNTAFLPFQGHNGFGAVRGGDPAHTSAGHTPFISEYGTILQAEDIRIGSRGVLDPRRTKCQ